MSNIFLLGGGQAPSLIYSYKLAIIGDWYDDDDTFEDSEIIIV